MINDRDRIGQQVIGRETSAQRLLPFWLAHGDLRDHRLPITAGLTGAVISVTTHADAPYERFTVQFGDGSRAIGLSPGADFDWTGCRCGWPLSWNGERAGAAWFSCAHGHGVWAAVRDTAPATAADGFTPF